MSQQTLENPKSGVSDKIVHFALFAFLWAVAILWHYLRRPVDYSEFFVLFIPAVLVMARPKTAIFLLAMCFGYFHIFLYEMPFSTKPNHPTLIFLINWSIILSAVWILIRNTIQAKRLKFDQEQWFDLFRPLVIIAINIVYLMAVFNKLNTDFFDINYSPVTRLINFYYVAPHLMFIPDLLPRAEWVMYFGMVATLVIETAIPLMLFFRRTRLWGILLGVAFHMVLSIRLYPSMAEFPTLLFAAYILALPDTTIPMLRELWRKITRNRQIKSGLMTILIAGAWFFFLLPMVFQWPQQQDNLLITQNEVWSYSWVVYLIFYYVILFYLLKRTRGGLNEPPDIRWIQPRNIIVYIVPLLILLNGFTPYMGLKNKGSWNMYSNLRTEGMYNNHLFMPNIRLFPFMDEVCIIDVGIDDGIMKFVRNKQLVTESHFTDWARSNPDSSAEFFYNGEHYNVERIGDYPQFVREKSDLERWFWIMRSGEGFDYIDWCQQYIPNDVDGPVLYLDDWTYILWSENSKWSGHDAE